MNVAPSPLKTGWITLWIALGVLMIILFVGFPMAMTYRARAEYARYQGCVNHTETNCNPSLAWALNGWSLTAAVTSTPAVVATTSTVAATPTSIAIVTPPGTFTTTTSPWTLTVNGKSPLVTEVKAKEGSKLTLKLTIATDQKLVPEIRLSAGTIEPTDPATLAKLTKQTSKTGLTYTGSITLPTDYLGTDTSEPVALEVTIRNAAGDIVSQDYNRITVTK